MADVIGFFFFFFCSDRAHWVMTSCVIDVLLIGTLMELLEMSKKIYQALTHTHLLIHVLTDDLVFSRDLLTESISASGSFLDRISVAVFYSYTY